MKPKLQRIAVALLGLAGAGTAQTFCGGLSDPYCDHARCRIHGYPYEDRCTVRVVDYPPRKKPELLEAEKKQLTDNPLQNRLTRRMEDIATTNYIRTNSIPINMAPGLAPEN
jgi:hypothetical protein